MGEQNLVDREESADAPVEDDQEPNLSVAPTRGSSPLLAIEQDATAEEFGLGWTRPFQGGDGNAQKYLWSGRRPSARRLWSGKLGEKPSTHAWSIGLLQRGSS